MSITHTSVSATSETSGIFAEAVGGIATIVLAIIALAGTASGFLLSIATIVFGAALLIEGTSITSDYVNVVTTSGTETSFHSGFGGLAAVFMAGIAGIILGVLALLGINAGVLCAVAVIVFGSALLLSSSAMLNLHTFKVRLSGETFPFTAAAGSAGAQVLAGIAAVVLGILAVAGTGMQTLALVALLVLGAAILVTGNGMNNAVSTMFRAPRERAV